mmetsp:Transcript_145009/g.377290  ORF Transcript_145009/g.377290 Transcript_145009/m.377290 type:complete len:246 (+) Transcript_145009:510-1247(+)
MQLHRRTLPRGMNFGHPCGATRAEHRGNTPRGPQSRPLSGRVRSARGALRRRCASPTSWRPSRPPPRMSPAVRRRRQLSKGSFHLKPRHWRPPRQVQMTAWRRTSACSIAFAWSAARSGLCPSILAAPSNVRLPGWLASRPGPPPRALTPAPQTALRPGTEPPASATGKTSLTSFSLTSACAAASSGCCHSTLASASLAALWGFLVMPPRTSPTRAPPRARTQVGRQVSLLPSELMLRMTIRAVK